MLNQTINNIHKKHLGCRLCGSSLISAVIPMHPIPIGEHYSKENLIKDAPRYPIDIYQCSVCKAVQTNDDIDSDFLWKDYTYFSGQTDKIVKHFDEFSNYITKTLQLKIKIF